MASTLSLYLQLKGVVGTELVAYPSTGLHSPTSISLTNDLKFLETASVSSATATEILTSGSGADVASATFIMLIPTVEMTFVWELASAANNSSARCAANVPFFLSTGKACPYNATPDTAAADTPASIVQITAYQSTGSAAKVHIFAAS